MTEGLQSFLLQVEVSEIVVHEACEPNAVIDLFDAEFLASEHAEMLILLGCRQGRPQAARSWNG
jgi:hypothetical protein